jgi:hypothetical protein
MIRLPPEAFILPPALRLSSSFGWAGPAGVWRGAGSPRFLTPRGEAA